MTPANDEIGIALVVEAVPREPSFWKQDPSQSFYLVLKTILIIVIQLSQSSQLLKC